MLFVIGWQHQSNPELKAEGESRCTIELEPNVSLNFQMNRFYTGVGIPDMLGEMRAVSNN